MGKKGQEVPGASVWCGLRGNLHFVLKVFLLAKPCWKLLYWGGDFLSVCIKTDEISQKSDSKIKTSWAKRKDKDGKKGEISERMLGWKGEWAHIPALRYTVTLSAVGCIRRRTKVDRVHAFPSLAVSARIASQQPWALLWVGLVLLPWALQWDILGAVKYLSQGRSSATGWQCVHSPSLFFSCVLQ